jgi:hypothetical protein
MFPFAPRPACAGTPDPGPQQTEQAVARALNLSGSDPAGSFTLKILRPPLPAKARVRLLSMQKAPDGNGVLARMACQNASQCLPFYVVVRGINSPSLAPSAASDIGLRMPAVKPPLHAGARVEIVEELSGLRFRTAGVCLQPGSIGDRIRVRTLSTHRVLEATIASLSLVKVEQ